MENANLGHLDILNALEASAERVAGANRICLLSRGTIFIVGHVNAIAVEEDLNNSG